MSQESMFKDAFEYPIDWAQVRDYHQSTLIGKMRETSPSKTPSIKTCQRNGRTIAPIPNFRLYESQEQIKHRYGIYGPNCVIYLCFLHRLIILMIFASIFTATPLLIINLKGDSCSVQGYCVQDSYLYFMSIFSSLNSKQTNLAQVLIWLVMSIILSLYFIYMRIHAIQTYKQINNSNITEADYSIIIRRIPQDSTTQDIRRLVEKQIANQIVVREKISFRQANDLLQIEDIEVLYKMKNTIQQLNKEVIRYKQAIQQNNYQTFQASVSQPFKFAGTAIVIFKSIKANDFINKILNRRLKDQITSYFLPFLDPRTQFQIRNKYVSIYRTPEPNDILWLNLGYPQKQRIWKKAIFTILTLLILAVSAVLSYLIGLFKQKYSNRGKNIYISILSTVIVFIFNIVIQKLLILATQNQKLDTRTNLQTEQFHTIVFHQSINLGFFSIIVPLIVEYPDKLLGTVLADFPTVMTTMIAFKAIVSMVVVFLLQYFHIEAKIYRTLLGHGFIVKTQYEANKIFKGIQIRPESKCADIVQLVWFGFIFGIVSPICIWLACIGLGLFSLCERILYNSRYCIPGYGKNRFNIQFMNTIGFTPLIIGLANLLLHILLGTIHNQEIDPKILAVIIANIALGGLHVLVPWQIILQKFKYNTQSSSDETHNKGKYQLTYKKANPANSRKIQPRINQKIITIEGQLTTYQQTDMKQANNQMVCQKVGTYRNFNLNAHNSG